MTQIVGIIGLGNMGGGMAATLVRAGFKVLGSDPQADSCNKASEAGVEICESIAALCQHADVVLLSLPTAQVVETVVCGSDGVLANARNGQLLIDTSTSEPSTTRRLAIQLAEVGVAMIDAPVSGGPKGAATGTMGMLLGGETTDIARAESVLDALSAKKVHIGPVSAGHVAKIANNLLCAAQLVSNAEVVRMAAAAGVDPEKLIAGINTSSGRSGVSEVNFPTWVLNGGFDSGFTMALMRKDVGLAKSLAESLDLQLPLLQQVAELWAQSADSLADGEDFNRIVSLGYSDDTLFPVSGEQS